MENPIIGSLDDVPLENPKKIDEQAQMMQASLSTSEEDMNESILDCSSIDMLMMSSAECQSNSDCGAYTLQVDEVEPSMELCNMHASIHEATNEESTAACPVIVSQDAMRDPLLALSDKCSALTSQLSLAKEDINATIQDMRSVCVSSIEDITRRSDKEIQQYRNELDAALTEKRRLHNCIQEMKGNIRVFCRVRPSTQDPIYTAVECRKGGQILTVDLPSKGIDRNGQPRKAEQKTYSYDSVFGPSASQADIYGEVSGMVDSCYDGYHCTVIAYGQTGSG